MGLGGVNIANMANSKKVSDENDEGIEYMWTYLEKTGSCFLGSRCLLL